MQQSLISKISKNLTENQKRFIAEFIGTFIVVVLATGSVVIDAKTNGILGIPFIAFAPFVGVAIGIYLFGKISMAHFNPAVTVGFFITKHMTTKIQLAYYFSAQILGALLGSLFVKYFIGTQANRIERFWWDCYRRYGWFRYLLFSIYIWCFFESRTFFSSCFALWSID